MTFLQFILGAAAILVALLGIFVKPIWDRFVSDNWHRRDELKIRILGGAMFWLGILAIGMVLFGNKLKPGPVSYDDLQSAVVASTVGAVCIVMPLIIRLFLMIDRLVRVLAGEPSGKARAAEKPS